MSFNYKMNKLLRVTLSLTMITMVINVVLHLFFPRFVGMNSAFGLGSGWHREISFWNVMLIPFIIALFWHYDWIYLQVLLLSLSIGCFLIGTNHLIGYLQDSTKPINMFGMVINYSILLGLFIGWRIEKRSIKI